MKLTVLGATGRTGVQVVEQALAAGHHVTAVVRDPAKLTLPAHADLDVGVADAMRPESIVDLVVGRDAVISALGGPDLGPSTVCEDGARSAVAAMRQAGVRRAAVISSSAIHTTGDGPVVRAVLKPMLGRVLRHPNADLRKMEEVVGGSDLDWTIVCPPRLTDGRRTGAVRSSVGRTVAGMSMSRADLAATLLAAVVDDALIGHRLFVSAGRS